MLAYLGYLLYWGFSGTALAIVVGFSVLALRSSYDPSLIAVMFAYLNAGFVWLLGRASLYVLARR